MPWGVGHSFLGNDKTCHDEDGLVHGARQLRLDDERAAWTLHGPHRILEGNGIVSAVFKILNIF